MKPPPPFPGLCAAARRSWRLVAAALPLAFLPAAPIPAHAATPAAATRAASEFDIKARYLSLFVDYVTWPEGIFAAGDSPIVIGVVGQNPFGDRLEEFTRERPAGARPVVVRYAAGVREIGACQLVFTATLEPARLAEIAGHFKDQPVLLVANGAGGLTAGFHLEFRLQSGSLRFAVDLERALADGLNLNARLLSSALEVRGKRTPLPPPR